jgi:hypothetical protein
MSKSHSYRQQFRRRHVFGALIVSAICLTSASAQETRPTLNAGSGPSGPNATDINSVATKKKVYPRGMPIDPLTGKSDWILRSSYDVVDATSWGGENVFDIHSAAKGTALNGEKYGDW